MTPPPSQVPLYNRYGALQVEPNNIESDSPTKLEVPQSSSWSTPSIKTASIKTKNIVVTGNSLLKGAEGCHGLLQGNNEVQQMVSINSYPSH